MASRSTAIHYGRTLDSLRRISCAADSLSIVLREGVCMTAVDAKDEPAYVQDLAAIAEEFEWLLNRLKSAEN